MLCLALVLAALQDNFHPRVRQAARHVFLVNIHQKMQENALSVPQEVFPVLKLLHALHVRQEHTQLLVQGLVRVVLPENTPKKDLVNASSVLLDSIQTRQVVPRVAVVKPELSHYLVLLLAPNVRLEATHRTKQENAQLVKQESIQELGLHHARHA